jgi:hypothetical protein
VLQLHSARSGLASTTSQHGILLHTINNLTTAKWQGVQQNHSIPAGKAYSGEQTKGNREQHTAQDSISFASIRNVTARHSTPRNQQSDNRKVTGTQPPEQRTTVRLTRRKHAAHKTALNSQSYSNGRAHVHRSHQHENHLAFHTGIDVGEGRRTESKFH